MTAPSELESRTGRLRTALVLRTTEDVCTVLAHDEQSEVAYAVPFPGPRVERVSPGHVVAIATADSADLIVWRWYDAVVVAVGDGEVRLWEPAHGEVVATPRDPQVTYALGSRAYLSAGLAGAEWWVEGPSVGRAEDADVELAEVDRFFTQHGLWDRLT